jgi:hypothetical protein
MAHWTRLARRSVVVAAFVGSACGDLVAPVERVVVMDVAPQRVSCQGVAPQECLRVREHPDTAWALFYQSIDGFEFEPGFDYTLRVAVRAIRNPPQDGSSLEYRLLAILRKEPSNLERELTGGA